MNKLLFFWKELLATFWFVPVLLIIFSIALSAGLIYTDRLIDFSRFSILQFFLVASADSARIVLSTISGAMIGVAGTVFSVTLVALALASSQLGPRLIKNFMYVRLNQVVLGAYISTYLYSLLVLNTIRDTEGYTFIPFISILVAILAAIMNIVLLIVFIHQIATSIQADKVISDISDFISKQVLILFPEKMSGENEIKITIDSSEEFSKYQNKILLKSPKSGYLQYINNEALIETISDTESLLELYHRPGSYLVDGVVLATLYTNSTLKDDDLAKILKHFVIGKTKTPHQDLEYSIHQMVEIASRALSPGVNDPYTAIACIDHLTSTMSYLAQVNFPTKYRYDEDEHLRVIVDTLDFEGVLDAAFNQIRQFSDGSTAVIIRLMEALITIHGFTEKEVYRKAVIKHAKMVLSTGKEFIKEKNDIEDLAERADKILN